MIFISQPDEHIHRGLDKDGRRWWEGSAAPRATDQMVEHHLLPVAKCHVHIYICVCARVIKAIATVGSRPAVCHCNHCDCLNDNWMKYQPQDEHGRVHVNVMDPVFPKARLEKE